MASYRKPFIDEDPRACANIQCPSKRLVSTVNAARNATIRNSNSFVANDPTHIANVNPMCPMLVRHVLPESIPLSAETCTIRHMCKNLVGVIASHHESQ